ncbi:MAG: 30S ribosome-binding factor RbfA [Candidatus Competibacter sp.]|nr:30S ribosome-binding factor RbfA [Candidatus Competibacter sp.]MDG4606427.1 30S ribosome-binding factor RbfA [Candidatus Contendobacter sp.]HRD49516.1 30S ribosome-binding factor RbfA [Candidatus Contendobacter sp.]
MANVNPRIRRIGEQIRRELAELIRTELHDSRLTLVSTTSIEVSRDLAHARVYVTVVCEPDARAGLVAELNRAAPLLRRELGRRMHIRTVPKLEFRYDEVVEHGARLSALIDAAVAADASRHRDDEGPPMNDAHPENAA